MTTPMIDKSQALTGEQPHSTSSLALLAAIVLFAAITPTILMTAPAVAAQLASQWQLSPSQIGDLFSTELGAMSLATLPAFWWLKRVDWRRAALLAGALFIVTNLLSIWAQGYGALLALRFCSALAGGSLMIICLSSAASTANPSRTYGLWVMGQLVVGAIGLSILPRLFEHYGLAACYLLLALLMSLCLPLARYFPQGAPTPEKPRGRPPQRRSGRRCAAFSASSASISASAGSGPLSVRSVPRPASPRKPAASCWPSPRSWASSAPAAPR